MNQRIFLFLGFLLLLNTACTYKPSGEEFVKIKPPTHVPALTIDLNFATDTIYIPRFYSLTFSYNVNGDPVNWGQYVLNGKSQPIQDARGGFIGFNWWFHDTTLTTCPLELKIFTKSLSGSIADKMGVEGYLISRKWTLILKEPYQLASKITRAAFVDGSLKLEWEMYKGLNFKSYKIYKTIQFLDNPKKLVATITSQQQTSFVDNTYHGEHSDYQVITNDELNGNSRLVSGPLPTSFASTASGHGMLLSWKKTPYYKNLKGYAISYYDDKSNQQTVGEVNSGDTESLIFSNPMFAYYYDLYLTPLPLTDSYFNNWILSQFLSSRLKVSYGTTSPTFNLALAGMAPVTYLMNNAGILVFDHQTQLTTRCIKYDDNIFWFDVSANNKYLISIPITPNNIYFEDLNNPANSKKIDLSLLFPQMGSYISVSNIATGIIINAMTVVIYDFQKQIKLAEINLINKGNYFTRISSSGNFFFCETFSGLEYFQYKDNQIIRLPSTTVSGDYVIYAKYLPGTNEKLVRVYRNRIEVVDCKSWTVEKQWSFPNLIAEVYNLDLLSNKVLLLENTKLTTFDVLTGTKEVVATTKDSNYTRHWDLFYNQGQILWSEGKSLR